jgi:hypothetical protein
LTINAHWKIKGEGACFLTKEKGGRGCGVTLFYIILIKKFFEKFA